MVHIDKLHQPGQVLNIDRLLLHDPHLVFLIVREWILSHLLQFRPIPRELHELRWNIRKAFLQAVVKSFQLPYLLVLALLIALPLVHGLLK